MNGNSSFRDGNILDPLLDYKEYDTFDYILHTNSV